MVFLVSSIAVLATSWLVYRLIKSGEFHPWYTRLFGLSPPQYPISGQVDEGFEEVRRTFEEHFVRGREVGSSVAVFSGDKIVANLFGGYENFEKKTPYSESTLQLVYSCSKVLESIGLARLVDQGHLSYEDKVSSIWPEFANGKENVTVTELMCHEAGLTFFSDPQPTQQDIRDDLKRSTILANHPHLWKGKKVRSYHAISRGWITNEVVKRADPKGRTLGKIYEQEVNKGLDVEFYLGLNKDLVHRRSTWYPYPKPDLILSFLLPTFLLGEKATPEFSNKAFKKGAPLRNVFKLKEELKDFENGEDIIKHEAPSANGFTNARTLATVAGCLANNGKLNGFELISEKGLELAMGGITTEYDTCLFSETTLTRCGLGVFEIPELNLPTKFYGWPGLGGSLVIFNPEYKFAFAYVMNGSQMSPLIGGRSKNLLIPAFKAHLKTFKH